MKKHIRYIIAIIIVLVIISGFVVFNNPRRKQENVINNFVNDLFTVSDFDRDAEYFTYSETRKVNVLDEVAFKNFNNYTTDEEFVRLMDDGVFYNYIMGSLTNNYVSRVIDVTHSRPILLSKEPSTYIIYTLVAVEVIYKSSMVKIIDHIPCEFTLVKDKGFKISKFEADDQNSFLIPKRH